MFIGRTIFALFTISVTLVIAYPDYLIKVGCHKGPDMVNQAKTHKSGKDTQRPFISIYFQKM